MKTGILFLLALSACAAPGSMASSASSAAGAASSAESLVPVAPTPRGAAAPTASTIDAAQVDADVRLMAGGMFAVDHIGPQPHAAVLARFHATPLAYMARARALAAQADARGLASSYFEAVVEKAAETHAAQAAETARALLPRYHAAHAQALVAPAWDGQTSLLEDKITALTQLASR